MEIFAAKASSFSAAAVALNPTMCHSSFACSSFSNMTPSRGTQFYFTSQGLQFRQLFNEIPLSTNMIIPNKSFHPIGWKRTTYYFSWESSVLCHSCRHNTETKQPVKDYSDYSDITIDIEEDKDSVMPGRFNLSSRRFEEVCKFAYNDAKFVSERVRSDMFLLSCGILRLDARAREDFAILGLNFLKLDARAREDTEKIDHDVKKRAICVKQIASVLKNNAQSRLKSVADKHWSDGALEADLRRADFCAKQRAMEDALMALQFMKDVDNIMVSQMNNMTGGSVQGNEKTGGRIMLEKNGKTIDFFPGEVSTDRIAAIQEAYMSMASALSEADGIDYTDPEELELLVAALIDLDGMDGKSSVSLLAECSSSPDVSTRQALANALVTAPSMWTLGNAGMGALQRLAEDSNPTIAAAASRAIKELKKQWEIEVGDSWRFMVDHKPLLEDDEQKGN